MVGDNDGAPCRGRTATSRNRPRRSGRAIRELLARVPAIVYVADAGETGRWHYVSPQIEQILGYSPAEWCADPELWLERLHPDDRDWVRGARRRRKPRTIPTVRRSNTGCSTATDGSSGSATTPCWLASRDGELRWHGVLSDITERKQVEAELERRAAQQAAVALLGEHALEGAEHSRADA